jgi:hypothetical protein
MAKGHTEQALRRGYDAGPGSRTEQAKLGVSGDEDGIQPPVVEETRSQIGQQRMRADDQNTAMAGKGGVKGIAAMVLDVRVENRARGARRRHQLPQRDLAKTVDGFVGPTSGRLKSH